MFFLIILQETDTLVPVLMVSSPAAAVQIGCLRLSAHILQPVRGCVHPRVLLLGSSRSWITTSA